MNDENAKVTFLNHDLIVKLFSILFRFPPPLIPKADITMIGFQILLTCVFITVHFSIFADAGTSTILPEARIAFFSTMFPVVPVPKSMFFADPTSTVLSFYVILYISANETDL